MKQNHQRREQGGPDMRALALDTLLSINRDGRASHLAMRDALQTAAGKGGAISGPDARDRRFYRRLVEGVLEQRIRLDYAIDQFAKTKTSRMKPVIREIMRMAAYQILEMDTVPDSAAVNEAVRLAVRRGFGNLRGFVNGVLRTLAREKNAIVWPDRERDPLSYLSVMYSMPLHLAERWVKAYGYEQTGQICRALQEEPRLTARLRPGNYKLSVQDSGSEAADHLQSDPGVAEGAANSGLFGNYYGLNHTPGAWLPETEKRLQDDGFEITPAPWIAPARYLTVPPELEIGTASSFREGLFAIQDLSSMLAVLSAGIRPGDTVLDLAAAPGGKSLLAADLLGGTGRVIARDVSEQKAELIREQAERLHIRNVDVQVWDGTIFDAAMEQAADVVIADLPCSGLGVIGRKPDIRYTASDEKTESLVRLQRAILKQAVRYVKPGGTLLYSTCTFDPRENQETVAWLIQTTPATPDPIAPYLPEALRAEAGEDCFLQLLPGVHPCDGFFMARMKL